MLKKLMVRTWFGELPPWTEQFIDHVRYLHHHGWDFLLVNDYGWYAREVKLQLGIDLPDLRVLNKRKCGDWDPCIGAIFQKHIKAGEYDYWGHYNLDAVYGRLDRWLPDNFLRNIDIFGNDPGAICGPFSVYRNCEKINNFFMRCPTWRANFANPDFLGWDELDFSRTVVEQSLRGYINFASGFFTSHDHLRTEHRERQEVRIEPDGKLIDALDGREVMMYHFNQTRRWPVIP